MIRLENRKMVHFPDFPEDDLLTDPEKDFWEMENLCALEPDTADNLRKAVFADVDTGKIVGAKNLRSREQKLIAQCTQKTGGVWEVWPGTPESRVLPEAYIHTEKNRCRPNSANTGAGKLRRSCCRGMRRRIVIENEFTAPAQLVMLRSGNFVMEVYESTDV